VTGKAIDFALNPGGRLKYKEIQPESLMKPPVKPHENLSNGNGAPQFEPAPEPLALRVIPLWLRDTFGLITDMRGWKYGLEVYIPQPARSQDRQRFLRETLVSFIAHYLLLDVIDSTVKLFPGVGTVTGASIFYPDLPPFERYAISTIIHFLTGSALVAGFRMVYDLLTLISVSIFHSAPSSWPPIMDNPWISDSMHVFWARRWHQTLRQTFMVFGGYPGKVLFGNLGLVFGMFVASGMFHECSMHTMARGWDWTVPLFFAAQGPLLLGERVWRRVTGRRVGGWPGMVWVYFNIMVLSQPLGTVSVCLDVWQLIVMSNSGCVAFSRTGRGNGHSAIHQPNPPPTNPGSPTSPRTILSAHLH